MARAEDQEGRRRRRTPVDRPEDDRRQGVADRKVARDQLRSVAEAGVEEAAHPGARVLGDVLGRLADEIGERDERDRRRGRRGTVPFAAST